MSARSFLYTFWKDSYAPYWWHDFYVKTRFNHGGGEYYYYSILWGKKSISDICIDVCDKELLFVSCPLTCENIQIVIYSQFYKWLNFWTQ